MSAAPRFIRYEFTLPDGTHEDVQVNLDPKTLAIIDPEPANPPAWAALEFNKCSNCPFKKGDCTYCPIALRLSGVVEAFKHLFSYEMVKVRVTVPERTYLAEKVSIQQALSSLLGVFMTTSGCPVMSKLRPMVRLHLPFAGELETLIRSTSMYLLSQYFVARDGKKPDWTLDGLAELYNETGKVNRAFADRLRAASVKDANVNALIVLHTYSASMPNTIDDQLEEIRFLFSPVK